VNAQTEDGVTALMLAAWNQRYLEPANEGQAERLEDQADTVQLLLDSGAEINARAIAGDTPLLGAARLYSSTNVVRLLLDRGAEIDGADEDGRTPLMYSSGSANMHTMRLLLRRGCHIDQRDSEGRTALSYAAETSSFSNEAMRFLT